MNAYKTFRSLDTPTRYQLLILFITALFFWTSITTLLPILPIYIEDLGGTKQQVGIVMGSFAIGLIFSRAWLGYLVDRRSRKLVITIGAFVAATAPLGYLVAPAIPSLMVIRAYHGICVAAFATGYSTLVVDFSPIKQRGEIIGYMSLTAPLGMGIGPALGSVLQKSIDYEGLFLLSAGLGTMALLMNTRIREPSHKERLARQQEESDNTPDRTFWQLFREPALLVPTVIFFLAGTIFGGIASFLPLFIREANLAFSAGAFYSYAAVSGVLGRIVSGGSSDRYGRGLFITASLFSYALSMFLLIRASSPLEITVAAIAEGAGGGILFPMLLALISDRSRSGERGRAYAICIGGFDVGTALAGPLLGVFEIGYRTMFTVSLGLAGVALFVFFTLSNKSIARSFRFAWGLDKDRYAIDL
ncbi:MFS transporter [Pannus brasiliensis CCIBt3594]|uniref:MFS transporter n=1 Tax=Pannus brasiliensis CCIBt3594 TaxID=1427578 RepID=A0AAW9QU68_9CHRO